MGETLTYQPFTGDELAEKRRYVESRNVDRSHWSAAELDLIDREGRWLATLDEMMLNV